MQTLIQSALSDWDFLKLSRIRATPITKKERKPNSAKTTFGCVPTQNPIPKKIIPSRRFLMRILLATESSFEFAVDHTSKQSNEYGNGKPKQVWMTGIKSASRLVPFLSKIKTEQKKKNG